MSRNKTTGNESNRLKADISDLLSELDQFENSGEGWGYELRLDLSDLIIGALTAKGWTQRELADAAGMRPAFVSRLVHAESNCTFEVAGRILYALGTKPRLTSSTPKGNALTFLRQHTTEIMTYGEKKGTKEAEELTYRFAETGS